MGKKRPEPAPHDALEVIEPESENKTRGIDLLRVLGRDKISLSKKIQYATLRGMGYERRDICQELEIVPDTARNWEREDWYPPIFEEALNDTIKNDAKHMSRRFPKALRNLDEALDEGKKWATLRVLDQQVGQPRKQTTITVGVQENLAQLMAELRAADTPRLPRCTVSIEKPQESDGRTITGSFTETD